MDYVLRKPNTLDKSREFLIEVTVYAQADDEEVNGLEYVLNHLINQFVTSH